MQDRRYRPGDVLDDYCPRERRITDHAIVAMVDEDIQRTRCGSCDGEHQYKQAKVPAPRRKTQPPALSAQLDGLQGSTPRPQSPPPAAPPGLGAAPGVPAATSTPVVDPAPPLAAHGDAAEAPPPGESDQDREGGFRRSLIRATFPKLEGAIPVPRALPEFTIQSLNNRGRSNGGAQRHAGGAGAGGGKFRGRRRPAGGGSQDNLGPMRFREHGSGQGGQGQGQGPGQGQGQGQGGGRRRRGGKKNR